MGFGLPQECDSGTANGSIFAPMKSGMGRQGIFHMPCLDIEKRENIISEPF